MTNKVTKRGVGCTTLFGLPFAAGGLFMTWSLITTLSNFYAAQSWVEAPATIVSTALEEHRGDDSVSYEVVATYRYEFDGKAYTGDRVGVATDMEGDRYDRTKHRELKKLRDSGEKTVCYVDPEQPERAVLDRELRPSVVIFPLPFVICFNLAGFGIIGGAVYGARREAKLTRLRDQHADEPWRVRDDWAAGEIPSHGLAALAVPAGMALFWNGLSMPAFALAWLNSEETWVIALVGLFPLIGLGLIASLLVQLSRWLRYGRSTLRLAATPGVVGGELAGVVLAPAALRPDAEYRVKLACLRTVITRDSEGRSTTLQTEWEDERVVERTLADPTGKRGVPIRFTLPSDAKPTDDGLRDDGESGKKHDLPILWRLTVSSKLAGPDYKAEFDVPVFRTEDSRDGVVADLAPLTDYEREETLDELLAREGVRVTERGNVFELDCPPGRTLTSAAFAGGLGVVFFGVATGMGLYLDEWVKWIFVPAFGFFGLLLVGVGLDALLFACHLRIVGEEWTLRSGWVGFRGAGTKFSKDKIRSFPVKQGMTSSSGTGPSKKWNHVQVRLVGAKKMTIVRSLANRRAERLLIDEFKRRAGKSDE